ncbi:hypothetical protein LXA43DRAFT_976706 [Ganoderma leucocontextum]|nr:hypothetical protein LXA43DRAFT_976706 [Ganoderma leucocontextum]
MNMHPTVSPNFDPPPPTFNTLDSQQKSRLIRTSRKLGAVLGTTPHFAESGSPLPSRPPNGEKPLPRSFSPKHDRKRRQGSVFEIASPSKPYAYEYASSSSASSSAASLALPRSSTDSSNSDASTQSLPIPRSFARHVRDKSKSSGKRAPLPTPLVLRLNAVALPLSDPRLTTPPDSAATLKNSGLAPGGGARTPMPVTPTTPGTPATPTVTETRRKRLAKLKRTLGENVPAELVIPPRATPTATPNSITLCTRSRHRAHRRRTRSRTRPPARPSRGRPRGSGASPSTSSTQCLLPSPPSRPRPSHPGLRPKPQPQPHPLRRAPSLSSAHPPARSAAAPPPPEPIERPESGHGWATGGASWMGEWNRKDIHEVRRQLRNLKLR